MIQQYKDKQCSTNVASHDIHTYFFMVVASPINKMYIVSNNRHTNT